MFEKPSHYLNYYHVAFFFIVVAISETLVAQSPGDTLPSKARLTDCINYALLNQPLLQQIKTDEDITRQDIRISLSGWLPEVSLDANAQHYLKLPVSFFPNLNNPTGPKQRITSGVVNTSALQFSANQTIYSTNLFFAGKTAHNLRKLSNVNTQSAKVDLVVNVSKAFYDVLLSQQQLGVLNEDIIRLEKNYTDAYNQYKNGLTEKTDYQRATIALNNARAEKKNTEEAVKVKYAQLKQVMGAPIDKPLTVLFDSSFVEKEIVLDTLQNLTYDNRPEYQALQLNLKLQQARVGYYRWSFLPTVSAFGYYNIVYQNDQFSQLYNQSFPNSLIGIKASLPIFQGTSRWQNLRKAHLQYNRLNIGLTDFKNQLNTEYSQAMGSYKSNLNELRSARENTEIARSIFNTVKLQYNTGVISYLEVIVAETDLKTAQLNYLNALFRVLTSTLDVKKALGMINVK
jgi:outer membrane protein TolC